ncbi:MAG TPA: DNA polymerase/3'-5' exonuclease PolX [Solirubrobacteraceae bacterium]|jgi:DNA polymerase (family 10)|nr:DNA polymerase/3'-5' exonuclease PolX [Solirubrobacteraceae bacterium]
MADPTNSEIAAALDELGDLYELDGAIIHRIVAYRNAAKAIRDAPVSVTTLAREGRATELPGVGATIQTKVLALADDGAIPAAVKLRAKFPVGLLEMTRLPGLGPKRARRLFEELHIDSLDALEAAASGHQIRELKGFGPKAEESILTAVTVAKADAEADGSNGRARRVVLNRALTVGEQLLAALRAHPAADRVELAGSARRWTDSVKDLDIIATASDPGALARAAAELELVESAQQPSDAGVRVRTHTGLKVDLRIVAPDQFGNLLQHFTGSKEHNMALREAAVRRGLHVSEYGVTDDSTGETHRCAREEEVYALLGLEYIEPELRENRGELEAAAAGTLPNLITVADLRGDLHCHTSASDGTASIEEMALAARDAGYEYLAITDHSASVGVRIEGIGLHDHIRRIRTLSGTDAVGGITLLAGSEVNIAPDGSLDYEDEILAELDWVVASVHSSMQMDSAAMTERIVRAISNPLVDVIGHLSGRKIERRPPYQFDFPAIVDAALRTGTLLEINSSPDRRDMNDVHARAAASAGIPIVIDCDAHRVGGFEVARYGVATARRAWLEASAVANTRPWAEVQALRPRHR